MERNVFKYHNILRRYTQLRLDCSLHELEMLMYVYDEGLFTETNFLEYAGYISWDKKSFKDMRDRGYFIHRKGKNNTDLYQITSEVKRAIDDLYNFMFQEELPEVDEKVFKGKDRRHVKKVFKKFMRQISDNVREKSKKEVTLEEIMKRG